MIVDPKGKPAAASAKPNGTSKLVTAQSPFATFHRSILALAQAQGRRQHQQRVQACMSHLAGFERSLLGVSTALGEAHRTLLEVTGGQILTVNLRGSGLPPGAAWRVVDEEGTPLPILHPAQGKVLRLPAHVGSLKIDLRTPDGETHLVDPATQPETTEAGDLDPAGDPSPEVLDDATRDTEPPPTDEELLEEAAERFEEEERESRFESPPPQGEGEPDPCDDCGERLLEAGEAPSGKTVASYCANPACSAYDPTSGQR